MSQTIAQIGLAFVRPLTHPLQSIERLCTDFKGADKVVKLGCKVGEVALLIFEEAPVIGDFVSGAKLYSSTVKTFKCFSLPKNFIAKKESSLFEKIKTPAKNVATIGGNICHLIEFTQPVTSKMCIHVAKLGVMAAKIGRHQVFTIMKVITVKTAKTAFDLVFLVIDVYDLCDEISNLKKPMKEHPLHEFQSNEVREIKNKIVAEMKINAFIGIIDNLGSIGIICFSIGGGPLGFILGASIINVLISIVKILHKKHIADLQKRYDEQMKKDFEIQLVRREPPSIVEEPAKALPNVEPPQRIEIKV